MVNSYSHQHLLNAIVIEERNGPCDAWNGALAEHWNGTLVEHWNGTLVEHWNGTLVEHWDGTLVEHWNGAPFEHWNGTLVDGVLVEQNERHQGLP